MSHHHHHHHHDQQPQEEVVVIENQYGQEEVVVIEQVPPPVERLTAVCDLSPKGLRCDGTSDEGSKTRGYVKFIQESFESHCIIEYRVTGLKPGLHGFHIHEFSDFSNGCMSAGPHYNPHKKSHGGREDGERHVGDLGNIEANHKGIAEGRFSDHLIKLSGEHSVVGRSVMVHADPDDCGKGGHKESHAERSDSETTSLCTICMKKRLSSLNSQHLKRKSLLSIMAMARMK
jgi:Cu-Zn family superoxide dismutase